MTNYKPKTAKAYAFFHYKGKMADILDELPRARQLAKTPMSLEIKASKVNLLDCSNDSALAKIVEDAKSKHITHVLEATSPYLGNRKTAEELYAVLGNIFNSPLYAKNDPLLGGVTYRQGDKYVFMRK